MARNLFAVLGAGLLVAAATGGAAGADEPVAGDAPTQQQAQPPAAPTPPPGISIIPSPQWQPPTQAEGQVPGCPAGKLKPLDLLV